MIRETELRKGNLALINGEISEIVEICLNYATYARKGITLTQIDYDKIEPIPLTEEILLKCGFEIKKGKFGNEYHLKDFSLYTSFSLNISFIWDNYIKNIKHLHQLQNLYWCLCEKELQVNL